MVSVAGIGAVNYVTAGPRTAAPVLLLHPVGLDLTWWGDQFAAFVNDHALVAFDMPGHGRSARLDEGPSFDLMADVAQQVLEAAGGQPAHLVGVSVGGMIAQAFALRRPDLVRSLALVATLCDFPEPVRDALRERARVARTEGMARIAALSIERWFTASFRERRPDIMDRAAASLERQEPEFHAGMWDMISGLDLAARLPEISCPALVVTGAEDGNAPPSAAEKIASLIPGSSLTVLPGVGHFPPFEVPRRFNDLLSGFLATVV